MDIAKLPAFKENEKKGGYTVGFWKWLHGADAGFFVNQNYDADPEIAQVADATRTSASRCRWASTATSSTRSSGSGQGDPGDAAPAENTPFSAGPGSRKTALDARSQTGQRDARQARPGQEAPTASASAPTARAR